MNEEQIKQTGVNENKKLSKKEIRIVVNHEAEQIITEYTDAVNSEFEAGHATRFDVANFMIAWFKDHAPTDVIHELRRRLLDGFAMLEAVQKKYKNDGELPPDLRTALERHFFGSDAKETKRSKKSLKSKYIKDIHNDGEVA